MQSNARQGDPRERRNDEIRVISRAATGVGEPEECDPQRVAPSGFDEPFVLGVRISVGVDGRNDAVSTAAEAVRAAMTVGKENPGPTCLVPGTLP